MMTTTNNGETAPRRNAEMQVVTPEDDLMMLAPTKTNKRRRGASGQCGVEGRVQTVMRTSSEVQNRSSPMLGALSSGPIVKEAVVLQKIFATIL